MTTANAIYEYDQVSRGYGVDCEARKREQRAPEAHRLNVEASRAL